jgi:DNA primase
VSGLVSQATLEQIRAANDIVEVIGGALPLKRAGANFVALCPFHKEKSPSFNVNPGRQIFHCFGCHKGGDVFTFLREYENISFMDAVRRLAQRAGITLEMDNNPAAQESRSLKDKLLDIHEQITRRWQAALASEASGQIARDYLARRQVSPEAVQEFRLGSAPDAWDDTVNWARNKGFDLELVEMSGLIIRRDSGDGWYDRFRGRLMFPICDEQGRVVGFSGRVLSGDEKTAKYVNSPETPIFTKSRVFFGLHKTKRALLDAGQVIVCEGQLDLIRCYMSGVKNMVAPQGTALTADHTRILKRYVKEVVLCFDSDEAGQKAAERSLDSLLASGLAVRVAVIPAPDDPDSFIRDKGADAFRQLIEKAEGFFDFLLNRLCRMNDLKTDRGRQAVLERMFEALHKTGNEVTVDAFARKTAMRLGVSAGAVQTEFRKLTVRSRPVEYRQPTEDDLVPAEEQQEPEVRPSTHELWLLKVLFRHEELAGWIESHMDLDWVPHPTVNRLVALRLAAERSHNWHGVAALVSECEDDALRRMVTEVTAEDRPISNPEQVLMDVLTRLRNQHLDRQMASIMQQLGQPEATEDGKIDLLRTLGDLRARKQHPIAGIS